MGSLFTLRELRASDIDAVHAWFSNIDVIRYMLFPVMDRQESEAFITRAIRESQEKPRRFLTLGIAAEHDAELIGLCGMDLNDQSSDAEVWYLLDRSRWGQGIGTRVLDELVDIGFKEYDLHRIWATCLPENPGSARILEKAGFSREGFMRQNLNIHGQWRDSFYYALLQSDWNERTRRSSHKEALCQIRQATPDDARGLLAFLHALLAEDQLDIPLRKEECRWTEEQERLILDEAARSDNTRFFVVVDGRAIVGVLDIRGGTRKMTRHAGMLGMSILKPFRGRGIGDRLMGAALDWARSTGVLKRIELNVYARNTAAIHLYRKYGFVVEGIRRGAICENGTFLDDYLMALHLHSK